MKKYRFVIKDLLTGEVRVRVRPLTPDHLKAIIEGTNGRYKLVSLDEVEQEHKDVKHPKSHPQGRDPKDGRIPEGK